ncbi:hypothetical protein [Rhodophyticola porphyridii]|uniref:hypothetical protein n=1 Tax=Rhodophyticola porphyridii TaxID=1852017 RepID=UPI0035CF2800
MTTVISRLYADASTADAVVAALHAAGHPAANISVIAPGPGAEAEIREARVPTRAAAKYAGAMSGDNRLVVNRAPFTPFGAARNAMEIMNSRDSMDAGVPDENIYVEEPRNVRLSNSILSNHPRFLSSDMDPGRGRKRGLVSNAFRMPLLVKNRNANSAISGGRQIFPGKQLLSKKRKLSVISGGRLFTAALGMPMLSHRGPR